MKKCNMCKINKSSNEFAKDKSRNSGFSSRCKKCQKQLSRNHYLNNRNKYYLNALKHKDKKRKMIDAIKNIPCGDCGILYPPWCMDFDHVRGKKKFRIGKNKWNKSYKEILDEIAKCEVVCSNCHRHRTYIRLKPDYDLS